MKFIVFRDCYVARLDSNSALPVLFARLLVTEDGLVLLTPLAFMLNTSTNSWSVKNPCSFGAEGVFSFLPGIVFLGRLVART